MKNRHRTPSAILTATAPMNTPLRRSNTRDLRLRDLNGRQTQQEKLTCMSFSVHYIDTNSPRNTTGKRALTSIKASKRRANLFYSAEHDSVCSCSKPQGSRIGHVLSQCWASVCYACGCSAVGSASPCQGEGREFESRHPLKVSWQSHEPHEATSTPRWNG